VFDRYRHADADLVVRLELRCAVRIEYSEASVDGRSDVENSWLGELAWLPSPTEKLRQVEAVNLYRQVLAAAVRLSSIHCTSSTWE